MFGVSTTFKDLFCTTDLNELYENARTHLISIFAEQKMKGSGWALDEILFLELLIADYSPLENVNEELLLKLNISADDAGGEYFDIGKYWRAKRGVIVPQNKDDDPFCGLYALAFAKFKPERNPGRITKVVKEQIKTFNLKDVCLPLKAKDLTKIEEQNNLNLVLTLILC